MTFLGCENRRFVGSGVEGYAFGFDGLHEGFNLVVARDVVQQSPKSSRSLPVLYDSSLVWGFGRFLFYY